MLLEIYCDKFLENGNIRPAIEFHNGLNVVLGDELGANSIGKSTFLLVVDFIFGGDDYVKKALDIIKNVGEHTIFFVFEFNHIRYYFSRSTQNFQVVNECDKNHMAKKGIPIDDYRDWLAEQYQITQDDLSFRAMVSRFFRVYQRENLNEKRPLYGGFSEKDADAIIAVEKIFDKFSTLRDAKQAADDAKKQKKIFVDAQKLNYIPSVKTKQEYIKFEKQRELLIAEQESFTDTTNLQTKSSSEIQKIYGLKSILQGLRCKRTLLATKISQITAQLSGDSPKIQDDFSELEKFFANINLRKIKEIEQFHKELSLILRDELEEELARAQKAQDSIEQEIKKAEQELQDFDIPCGVSKRILREYSDREQQIKEISTRMENYEALLRLKKDIIEYTQKYDSLSQKILSEIESKINAQMRFYNDFIYGGKKESPNLKLSSDKYIFETANDSGTGTSYKSLIIFDLSFFYLTNLPAIIHDSLIFQTIGDEPLAKIIELYTQFPQKQIFIAIDKASSYHSNEVQSFLEKNAVLRLSYGGHCLFGRSWSDTTRHAD